MSLVWIIVGVSVAAVCLWIEWLNIRDCAASGHGNRRPIASNPKSPPPPKKRKRPMSEYIPSTVDARTLNNSTKQLYRVLTDAEKAQVDIVKQRGAEFIAFLHEIGGTDPEAERMASRDLSLAMTHTEDAVMRAVRHITK